MLASKAYWFADYIKLVLAVTVVAIHAGLVKSIQSTSIAAFIEFIELLAVPMFFGISGYLLEEKLTQSSEKESNILKASLIKYIKLYLTLSVLYLPLTFYGVYQHLLANGSIGYELLSVIKNYIFVGEQFYSWQLWYLLSTIIGMIILLLIPRKDSSRLLLYSCICFVA